MELRTSTRQIPVAALALMAVLFSFTGCRSLIKIKPAPVPAPVSRKAAVPDKEVAIVPHKNTRLLFVIERNKNANIVRYDANLTADGKLDPAAPVVASWELLAEDGSRKKLNWLEKKKAYGIKIKTDPSLNGYIMTLAAAPWMPLTVKKIDDVVRAEVSINGRPAVLEKMFIQARDRLLGPKVEYIELYGKELQTGEACNEKIIPK
jgi:hypothetical protein